MIERDALQLDLIIFSLTFAMPSEGPIDQLYHYGTLAAPRGFTRVVIKTVMMERSLC